MLPARSQSLQLGRGGCQFVGVVVFFVVVFFFFISLNLMRLPPPHHIFSL